MSAHVEGVLLVGLVAFIPFAADELRVHGSNGLAAVIVPAFGLLVAALLWESVKVTGVPKAHHPKLLCSAYGLSLLSISLAVLISPELSVSQAARLQSPLILLTAMPMALASSSRMLPEHGAAPLAIASGILWAVAVTVRLPSDASEESVPLGCCTTVLCTLLPALRHKQQLLLTGGGRVAPAAPMAMVPLSTAPHGRR